MAGNKINTKKKEDKAKVSRISNQASDENEETDFSLLRKPIMTNITGFAQARKIFDQATEELKNLLTTECDLLYECKVCRNIFRSLANFISHKRVYCREKFNTSIHGHFLKEKCTIQEVLKIRKLEDSYQESLKEVIDPLGDEDNVERIPLSKDITEIVEKIVKQKGIKDQKLQEQQLVFQKIPKSSVAVYQNIADIDDTSNDNMQIQVKELDKILSQKNAILQNDGKFKVQSNNKELSNADNVIQISDDEETEDMDVLKCKICELQFSTLKTLKFHMKCKHLESRLVYPCPDCLDIFSTSWSVYRHLFKVHRKTDAQIRRLRESIQSKAFRMNNPPAFYEKRKTIPKNILPQKITEEERLDQENQAWLEQLDGEGDGRRCGGCGRTFERRAALAAHAHTCARRHRRRIQIQIRKDYHKGQQNPYLPPPLTNPIDDAVSETIIEDNQAKEKIEENDVKNDDELEELLPETVTPTISTVDKVKEPDEETKEMETNDTVIQNKPYFYDSSFMNKLPFAQQAEKSNLNMFKEKMQADTDIDQLKCKKCDNIFNDFNELFNHMGAHYKWVRYACKLCNFKHFDFEKLPEHVKIVHKLKGDTDFYYSTVKAVDGTEAMELADTSEEVSDTNMISPDSRRPSRCSSDSSRLSDDSSSSSTRVEAGSRKRKATRYKNNLKKLKEIIATEDGDPLKEELKDDEKDIFAIENDSSSNSKLFEENSSDLDDLDEKMTKRLNVVEIPTVTSRRPIRKKTKPKNEDFEYDLSNLLKMEAQGYRDSQTVSTKTTQSKKKIQQDIQQNYDLINKECCGALMTLSRKSVGNSQGHMKNLGLFNTSKDMRIPAVFARPLAPKITKTDKISPKKDEKESKDLPNSSNPLESSNSSNSNKDVLNKVIIKESEMTQDCNKTPEPEANKDSQDTSTKIVQPNDIIVINSKQEDTHEKLRPESFKRTSGPITDANKPNIPIVPIKFRRQSLEVIKNPLIKKNITDFTKAGMKTKILVIKPINRKPDGTQTVNSTLKFQTIKLKDTNKSNLNEDKKEQVVVVKVPKVDCTTTRPLINNSAINNVKTSSNEDEKNCDNEDKNFLKSISDETILETVDKDSSEQVSCKIYPNSCDAVAKSETTINSDDITNVDN